jgi:branched-chain amino acid transport system substrate-binding protein
MLIKQVKFFLLIFLMLFSVSACGHKPSGDKKAERDEFESEEVLEVETISGSSYIAIAAPLTGSYRDLGKTIVEGASLAVEEFNHNLKNKKHRIGTIIIDDGGLVAEGIARADIVIAEKALAVIGHLNSMVSIEASNKYAAAKIATVSPASTHPKFTERPEVRGYVFRTIGTDRQLGEAAAKYVLSNKEFKKVAVLYNDKSYGISVASEFVRNLAQDTSVEVVFYETIPVRTKDHSKTAELVAAKKPDLVFFVGEYNDAGYLTKDLKSRLPSYQFLSVEGAFHQTFIDIAGKSAEGSLIIGVEDAPSDIAKKYKAKYGRASSGYVGSSYLAAKVILDAIQENDFKDNPELTAQSIAQNKNFDPNGDLVKPNFIFYKVENGHFVPQAMNLGS